MSQSFLAPWAALLVVHATVYRTFSAACGRWRPRSSGVVLAWGVGNALGLGHRVGGGRAGARAGGRRAPWFGEEATTVAATALVVLTTGFSGDDSMLLDRLGDTAIGIVVGLLVNAAVWPPLRRRTAITAWTASTTASAACWSTWARGCSTVRRRRCRRLGRPYPRPRRRARPRVGAGAPGAGERPDEPAPLGPRAPRPAQLGRPAAAHGPGGGRTRSMARTLGYVATGPRVAASVPRPVADTCSGTPAGRSPTPTRRHPGRPRAPQRPWSTTSAASIPDLRCGRSTAG